MAGPHPVPKHCALGHPAGLSSCYLKHDDKAQAYSQQLPVSQGQVAIPVPKRSVSVGPKHSCCCLCPFLGGCHHCALLLVLFDHSSQPDVLALGQPQPGPRWLQVAQPWGILFFAKAPPSTTRELLLQPQDQAGQATPCPPTAPHTGTFSACSALG